MPVIFGEATLKQQPNLCRRRRRQESEVRLIREHGSECLRHIFAPEQSPAGQHFVKHNAEGPNVGTPIDRLAFGLLRRHVGRSPEDHS